MPLISAEIQYNRSKYRRIEMCDFKWFILYFIAVLSVDAICSTEAAR